MVEAAGFEPATSGVRFLNVAIPSISSKNPRFSANFESIPDFATPRFFERNRE